MLGILSREKMAKYDVYILELVWDGTMQLRIDILGKMIKTDSIVGGRSQWLCRLQMAANNIMIITPYITFFFLCFSLIGDIKFPMGDICF